MKKNNFQLIMIAVFMVAALIGMLVFAGKIKIGKDPAGSGGTVILWGTANGGDLSKAIEDFNRDNPAFTVKYVQKNADTFDQDLLSALASGVGPDIFFLPDTLAYSYRNRITRVPYTTYPLSAYKTKFVGAGEVFLTSQGILAFPMSVDPMVMYYNRSMLDANGIVYPPQYWDEFPNLVSILTKKDDAKKIISSAVALGQFSNVAHAKDILSTLFMQAGSPIVTEQNGQFVSAMLDAPDSARLADILNFYTRFTDPVNANYSWNRSLQDSRSAFSAETLAFYFGYASELPYLLNKNPNQNFLVAPMPQLRNSNTKITEGHVTGLAVSAFSQNFTSAFTAASLMSTGDFAAAYAQATGSVPVRRDLLVGKPSDAYTPTFYNSALFAKSWLDPAPVTSDAIFSGMIDAILANTLSADQAIKDAANKLAFALAK
ncbi:MAG: extracellular solute-binding protein [bacterium]